LEKIRELETLKVGMSKQVRERFEELGELMDLLEECENRPPQTRS
jgi:hypothetical protein